MNFNREDVRKLIFYCWKRKLSAVDIAKEINNTLGEGTTTSRTCSNWVKKFENGNFEVNEKVRSGRPSYEVAADIERILEENKFATTRFIGQEIGISHEAVRQNLMKMNKRYLANVWVPHVLTEAAKEKRMSVCEKLLAMYRSNNFLHRIVTVDEMWVFWENTSSYTHKSWRGSGDEPATESKVRLTTRKHLATVFWDSKGVILMDVLENGKTMTATYYCSLLEKLKTAILVKRRRKTTDGFLYLLQDNACPHTAHLTQAKIAEMHLNILPHPPYSPDLAPSDYYLFSPMKGALKGQNCASSEEVQEKLQEWLNTKAGSFFENGINKLPGRWQRCIDNNGCYFEHLADDDE